MNHARVPPPAAAALVQLVIGLGGCTVVGLWFLDTDAFTPSLGNELTNGGRILGLVGGYLLAVQLLVMARIPWLERTLGTQRLSRWHASLGRYLVFALLGHALLIIWGYASTFHHGVVDQTTRFWSSYSGVVLSTIALGLLVGVGAVSARAARKRLSYETWYLVHLLVYLAIALTFTHLFANGAQFAHSQRNRVLWMALYGVAFGAVLLYRILIPGFRALRRVSTVAGVVPESADVISIYLHAREPDVRAGLPGQFVRLRFLTRDGWWQSHPFSLSAPVRDQQLRVTVKQVGDHTRALGRLTPGTRVVVTGPYGALTERRRRSQKVLLVAGGIGITPLVPLLQTLPGRPGDITLIYRASTVEQLVLREDIDAAAAARGAAVHYLPGSRDDEPVTAERVLALVPDVADHDVFLCGPDGFVVQVLDSLESAGVPTSSIHTEYFVL